MKARVGMFLKGAKQNRKRAKNAKKVYLNQERFLRFLKKTSSCDYCMHEMPAICPEGTILLDPESSLSI